MDIEYALDIDDLKAFINYYYDHNPKIKRSLTRLRNVTLPLGILFIVVPSVFAILAMLNIWVAIFLGLMGIYFILLGIFWPLYLRYNALKSTAKIDGSKPHRIVAKHKLSVNSEAVTDNSDAGTFSTKWDSIDWLASDAQYLYLQTRRNSFYIIPQRTFTDESSFIHFVETAKAYFEAAAALTGSEKLR